MWGENRYRRLRSAVYGGDGRQVVRLVRERSRDEPLQLAGDGLLIALRQHVDGARELAAARADALRDRGWVGDWDLADELDAELGRVDRPALAPIPVDLEDLAMHLGGGTFEEGARLGLASGDIWPDSRDFEGLFGEPPPPDWDDEDAWLFVWPEGSSEAYRDMCDFASTVADRHLADLLDVALDGRGAFRRFKDVLARHPDERERWFRFSNERERGRARAWLAAAGYRPEPPAM